MGHIDSIRGIAALLVLYHHVTSNFTNVPSVGAHGTLLYDVASYLNFGGAGVLRSLPLVASLFARA
jgi:peptidoglycan/LPS O-acetylase OafA/YrhL